MSFPRYPKYKDSGVEWLGEVPKEWQITPFYSCAQERDEPNQGMKERNLLSLSYGRIIQKDINTSDGLLPDSFETYQIIRKGDIVFRLTDLQNDKRSLRTAVVEDDVGIITSAYIATIPTRIGSRYLNYLLRAYDVTKVFYSMGGGLRQSMKFSDIKRLPVIRPPELEQQTIATFLDRETAKIDALVAEQENLIALLKEKRQAVISHAVTKGLDPTVPMKDSGIEWLGEVPAHWEVVKLSRVSEDIGDGLHGTPEYVDDSLYYFINGNNLIDGSIVFNEGTKNIDETEFSKYFIALDSSSLLLSINGTIGNVGLYCGERVMLGKSAAYVKCGADLYREYLRWIIESTFIKEYFERSVTGTTIKNLSLASIRGMPLPLPPSSDQMGINDFLNTQTVKLNDLTTEAQHTIELLKERHSALISAAVTGKIDVRGYHVHSQPIT